MVEVVLVLVSPTSLPRKVISSQKVIIGGGCEGGRGASPMATSCNGEYPFYASGGSSFGIAVGYGKVGFGPRTTHISSQKFCCFLGGVNLVSYLSSDYQYMSHSTKGVSYYLLSMRREDQFRPELDSRGCVVPITTH